MHSVYTHAYTHIHAYMFTHTHSHIHSFPPPALGPVALTRVPAVLKRRQLGPKPSPGAAGGGKDQRPPLGRSRPGQQSSRVWSWWRTRSTALQPACPGRWLVHEGSAPKLPAVLPGAPTCRVRPGGLCPRQDSQPPERACRGGGSAAKGGLGPAENGLSLSGTQGCAPGAMPPDEAQPGVRLVGPGLSHTRLLLAGPLGVDILPGS